MTLEPWHWHMIIGFLSAIAALSSTVAVNSVRQLAGRQKTFDERFTRHQEEFAEFKRIVALVIPVSLGSGGDRCPECNGLGKQTCPVCKGTGRRRATQS